MKRINVTQFHIDSGKRDKPKSCPIALAMKDAGFSSVQVVQDFITYKEGRNIFFSVYHSRETLDFIKQFDTGEVPVKPFSFNIE